MSRRTEIRKKKIVNLKKIHFWSTSYHRLATVVKNCEPYLVHLPIFELMWLLFLRKTRW